MSTSSVGLLVIATGGYLRFAEDLLADLDGVVDPRRRVVVNLFTDADDVAVRRIVERHRVVVRHHPAPALRWPEASLYRYDMFTRAASRLEGDMLVYLDADLRIRRDFTPLLRPDLWPGGMAAVRHPGYYRQGQMRRRGTWETRRASQAFVPRLRRRQYVCGGVFAGQRDALLAVSAELGDRIRVDAEAGVTALWHDESHWNWWVAHHRVQLLDPSWCFVPDYPWLAHLNPLIVAVDKGLSFHRESTPEGARREIAGPEGRADRGL